MRYFMIIITAVFFVATTGCHNTEDANEKISDCLEDKYGEGEADTYMSSWEVSCEEGEETCDACVDCIMDEDCDALLEGECKADCN